MNNYDRINVSRFEKGDQNGYLCSMCGQYTSLNESVSHRGYNLVCNRCDWKIKYILGDMNTLDMIHKVGEQREKEDTGKVQEVSVKKRF